MVKVSRSESAIVPTSKINYRGRHGLSSPQGWYLTVKFKFPLYIEMPGFLSNWNYGPPSSWSPNHSTKLSIVVVVQTSHGLWQQICDACTLMIDPSVSLRPLKLVCNHQRVNRLVLCTSTDPDRVSWHEHDTSFLWPTIRMFSSV